jgi:uncharacterized membrane protein
MLYGKDWKKMQPLIKSRSLVQIRTHAQKVFKKIGLKKALLGSARRTKGGEGDGANGGSGGGGIGHVGVVTQHRTLSVVIVYVRYHSGHGL